MVFMRFYTYWNFLSIFVLSIGIYYAFVWICDYMYFSWTYATILEMHKTQLYYLTILLCVGLCFSVDLFITGFTFNFLTSPSDYLRTVVNRSESISLKTKEFHQIFSKIKTHYVVEDMKKEEQLEKRRDELAKLVA